MVYCCKVTQEKNTEAAIQPSGITYFCSNKPINHQSQCCLVSTPWVTLAGREWKRASVWPERRRWTGGTSVGCGSSGPSPPHAGTQANRAPEKRRKGWGAEDGAGGKEGGWWVETISKCRRDRSGKKKSRVRRSVGWDDKAGEEISRVRSVVSRVLMSVLFRFWFQTWGQVVRRLTGLPLERP